MFWRKWMERHPYSKLVDVQSRYPTESMPKILSFVISSYTVSLSKFRWWSGIWNEVRSQQSRQSGMRRCSVVDERFEKFKRFVLQSRICAISKLVKQQSDYSESQIRVYLDRMKGQGLLTRNGRGRYYIKKKWHHVIYSLIYHHFVLFLYVECRDRMFCH